MSVVKNLDNTYNSDVSPVRITAQMYFFAVTRLWLIRLRRHNDKVVSSFCQVFSTCKNCSEKGQFIKTSYAEGSKERVCKFDFNVTLRKLIQCIFFVDISKNSVWDFILWFLGGWFCTKLGNNGIIFYYKKSFKSDNFESIFELLRVIWNCHLRMF